MSSQYKEIGRLLAIEQEHFEEEVQRLVYISFRLNHEFFHVREFTIRSTSTFT